MGSHFLSLRIFSIQGSNPCPFVSYIGRHCATWEVLWGLGAGRECVENFLLFFEIENLTSENKKGGKTTTTPAESESRSVTSDSATPWSGAHQAPLSMGFSRQEYRSGLPCPPPEDLLNPGIGPGSPAWQVDSLLLSQHSKSIIRV